MCVPGALGCGELAFYGAHPQIGFPAEYVGDGLPCCTARGTAFRPDNKVVRLPMKHGVPTGEYVDS